MQNATVLDLDREAAARKITPELILEHIKTLASDAFQGRCPGTFGEAQTLQYFACQFAQITAETGVAFQTAEQTVAAVEIATKSYLWVTISGEREELVAPADYIAGSRRMQPWFRERGWRRG